MEKRWSGILGSTQKHMSCLGVCSGHTLTLNLEVVSDVHFCLKKLNKIARNKKKYKIKFDLLSDEKLSIIKKYGVWGKKSFLGKKFMGIIRTTFLINSKGKIHKIWSNVRVKDHAKEVFSELKKI